MPPVTDVFDLDTAGFDRIEHVIKHLAGFAVIVLQEIAVALGRVIAVVKIIAIDGIDVGRHGAHILGPGMAQPRRGDLVF